MSNPTTQDSTYAAWAERRYSCARELDEDHQDQQHDAMPWLALNEGHSWKDSLQSKTNQWNACIYIIYCIHTKSAGIIVDRNRKRTFSGCRRTVIGCQAQLNLEKRPLPVSGPCNSVHYGEVVSLWSETLIYAWTRSLLSSICCSFSFAILSEFRNFIFKS